MNNANGLQKDAISYRWWKDKKIQGTILLLTMITLQIFAWARFPGLTTIHEYTVGMVFGWLNPLFYAFFIYIGLKMIFEDKIKIPYKFQNPYLSYWFIVFSIITIVVSTGVTQSSMSFFDIGKKPWGAFAVWHETFTSSGDWLLPSVTVGGLSGAFFYAVLASLTSGIGALIISILLILIVLSMLLTGTQLGLFKSIKQKVKTTKKVKKKKVDKEFSKIKIESKKDSSDDDGPIFDLGDTDEFELDKTNEKKEKDTFEESVEEDTDPFDYPF